MCGLGVLALQVWFTDTQTEVLKHPVHTSVAADKRDFQEYLVEYSSCRGLQGRVYRAVTVAFAVSACATTALKSFRLIATCIMHVAINLKDFKAVVAHAETANATVTARYTRPCNVDVGTSSLSAWPRVMIVNSALTPSNRYSSCRGLHPWQQTSATSKST
jgi:hypothetical protein